MTVDTDDTPLDPRALPRACLSASLFSSLSPSRTHLSSIPRVDSLRRRLLRRAVAHMLAILHGAAQHLALHLDQLVELLLARLGGDRRRFGLERLEVGVVHLALLGHLRELRLDDGLSGRVVAVEHAAQVGLDHALSRVLVAASRRRPRQALPLLGLLAVSLALAHAVGGGGLLLLLFARGRLDG